MVEKSDRAPLLDWEEIPPPDQAAPAPPREADTPPGSGGGGGGRDGTPSGTALSGRVWETVSSDRVVLFPGLTVKDQWEEKDQIVAVFVVTFDTRSGEGEPLTSCTSLPVLMFAGMNDLV